MRKMISRGEEVYSMDVFEILFQYEVSRSQRYPAPLSLLQIEAMPPSALNEDAIQKASTLFAAKINSHIRSIDIPSQTGNRIYILLPTTDDAGTRTVCERLLSIFKTRVDGKDDETMAFSLQIGASSHPGGSSLTEEFLLQKAEEALQQSKNKGSHSYFLMAK